MIDTNKLPNSIKGSPEILQARVDNARKALLDSPIGCIVVDPNRRVKHLSDIFKFRVESGGVLSEDLPLGTSFKQIFTDRNTRGMLRNLATEMFDDIDSGVFYAPYIPLTVLSDTFVVPSEGCSSDRVMFNSNGTVTVAEFLDGINAVRFGCNSDRCKVASADNVLSGQEFFNEGYNLCLKGVGSPFYNLYSLRGLFNPITRIEAAYILIVCLGLCGGVCDGNFGVGLNFNWEMPNEVLQGYTDSLEYKVSCVHYKGDESGVVSLDLKDYFIGSFSDFMSDIRLGYKAIPFPMMMSLVELSIEGVLYIPMSDSSLNPVDCISRGELCYILHGIAERLSD